jgi:hypothetical protein
MIHSFGCPPCGVVQRKRDLRTLGLRLSGSAEVNSLLPRPIPFKNLRTLCQQRYTRLVQCSASAVPARAQGRQTYKPPSFAVLIQDAANALVAAVDDGFNRLEIEFPVLPEDQDGETMGSALASIASGRPLSHCVYSYLIRQVYC